MFRKAWLSLSICLCLSISGAAAVAQAQVGAIEPQALAALAKEPPLTQADVEAYLKALPEIFALASGAPDPSAASRMAREAGFSETRFAYVSAKIGLAHALALGLAAEALQLDKIPEVLRPTDQEVALVKNNTQVLQEAALAAAQKVKGQQ